MRILKPNSEKVHKILLSIKLSLGTVGASAFAMNNDKLAFYFLIAAGAIDVLVSAFDNGKV